VGHRRHNYTRGTLPRGRSSGNKGCEKNSVLGRGLSGDIPLWGKERRRGNQREAGV